MDVERRRLLIFDTRISYGSKEHFFHFMWGYLLPAISFILNQADKGRNRYYFESCGPVMDRLTKEMIDLLEIDASILANQNVEFIQEPCVVPRWDIHLLRDYILGFDKDVSNHIAKFKSDSDLVVYLSTSNFTDKLRGQIIELRDIIISGIMNKSNLTTEMINDPWLVLRRSEQPDYYAIEGKAENKGYGMSRRGLKDIDIFVNKKKGLGLNITAYESGIHTIAHQIHTFNQAKGIIGIKGAEFANLIWMRENSRVIQIRPNSMRTPNVQFKLATLLNLNFIEVITEEGNFPSMSNLNLDWLT